MKFEDLMYNGVKIKVVVDLDDYFVETNADELENDGDTLDLTSITNLEQNEEAKYVY